MRFDGDKLVLQLAGPEKAPYDSGLFIFLCNALADKTEQATLDEDEVRFLGRTLRTSVELGVYAGWEFLAHNVQFSMNADEAGFVADVVEDALVAADRNRPVTTGIEQCSEELLPQIKAFAHPPVPA